MSFAEHRVTRGWLLEGVGVMVHAQGAVLKISLLLSPEAVEALGAEQGGQVLLLVGSGADAGKLRVRRASDGGRRLIRYGNLGALRVTAALWPGLAAERRTSERCAFSQVGAGEIEITLPAGMGSISAGQAQPKSAPDPTPPEPVSTASPSPAVPKARPKTTRPKTPRPKTASPKTTRPKTASPKTAKSPNAMTRVQEVAGLVKQGFAPAAIAARLELKVSTVGFYTHAARKAGLLPAAGRALGRPKSARKSPFKAPEADTRRGRTGEARETRDVTAELTAELTGDPGWEPGE